MNRQVADQFASNLAYCRRRAKLSQEELSFQAGLHRTEISLLERGCRLPRIDTLVKLAGALGVNSDELLDGLKWEPGEMVYGRFQLSGEGEP